MCALTGERWVAGLEPSVMESDGLYTGLHDHSYYSIILPESGRVAAQSVAFGIS